FDPALVAGVGVLVLLAAGLAVVSWRRRFSPAAQERRWTREWTQWDTAITHALQTTGEANATNLSGLPRHQLARALRLYAEKHPDDALTMTSTPLSLRADNFALTQKFVSHWKAAWEVIESEEAFGSVTAQIVDQLCALLGFTRTDARAYKGLVGYVVRAPALRLKIPPRFPIIFVPRHEAQESDLEALRDLMGVLNMVSYFALIVDLRDRPPRDQRQSLANLVREAIHDFIVLDGRAIRDLLNARDHARRLVEIILGQVDLTVVSPYVTSGPVPANMFFGRESELKTIVRTVRDTNFAIVGGRKIGKTSVLARVLQLLQDAPEYQPFYLDCQAVHSREDFFEAVDTMWRIALPARTPEAFRRIATDLPAQYPSRTIVMLFDEIDSILSHDAAEGEQLFRIFRALAQELPIRFVFCGEKTLNASLHDARLSFFNFCNLMPLTYLSPEEARRVVIDPMQEMGISLHEDGDLADQIVTLAAGHPNMVQYVCQKLIERINQRRERVILRTDVNAIGESAEFAEYFAEVSWGNATALERLITLLMLERPEITLGEMADVLRAGGLQVPPDRLEEALEGLTLYSILRRDGPRYTFATQAVPNVLKRSQDVYGLVVSFTQEIKGAYGA
ncbi:MAG: AAA family ATPase, partial [Chloroflexota bacterium]